MDALIEKWLSVLERSYLGNPVAVWALSLLVVVVAFLVLRTAVRWAGRRLKAVSDVPVLVGVGISTPDQAVDACREADGVVVGSALVRRLLEGGAPEAAAALVGDFRAALDAS